jgi:CheY-like chemotaxis protein
LVLLDLYMPEMDGFELLSLMQEDEKLSNVPVVVMSSDGDKEIIANCLSNVFKSHDIDVYRNGSKRLFSETH